jgi:hypothetical protein
MKYTKIIEETLVKKMQIAKGKFFSMPWNSQLETNILPNAINDHPKTSKAKL